MRKFSLRLEPAASEVKGKCANHLATEAPTDTFSSVGVFEEIFRFLEMLLIILKPNDDRIAGEIRILLLKLPGGINYTSVMVFDVIAVW